MKLNSIFLQFEYNYTQITSIEISYDEKLLSIADNEGIIIVYDLQKLNTIQKYNGKPKVQDMTFSKNNQILAVAISNCNPYTINLFNLSMINQQPIKVIKGHTSQINKLIFIDFGQKLVSCSLDKSIRIWNIDTLIPIKTEHAFFQIEYISYSEQLNMLAAVTSDGYAYLYQFKTFKLISMWKTHLNTYYVEFIPKNKLLVTLGSMSIKIWDLRKISTQKGAELVREIRRKTNLQIQQIVVKNNSIFACINDDSFSYKKSIIMYNIRSQKIIFSIPFSSYQSKFCVTNDFNTFFQVSNSKVDIVDRNQKLSINSF